ncbi:MAG: hypothetical protein Q9221_002868 [Calogaya cf. arnoldii]
MAIGLEEYGDESSPFAQTRDALYILSVMNQYSIKRKMPAREGEKLLRIAILSRALQVQPPDSVPQSHPQSLVQRRQLLARSLRERRKKGVVPVFISISWFIFALSLSIADAFGQVGDNQTAHDLAIGLLLAWLPVFVIATIVDRNPIGAQSIRRKLNEFVEDVRRALLNRTSRQAFLAHYGRCEDDLAWTSLLEIDDFFQGGFFARFAGQGRRRFHYGCAHSITAGMETAYIAAHGRDWLAAAWEAENSIIWAPGKDQGLFWFDFRMTWQMVSSILVVGDKFYYWSAGTALSVIVMLASIAFITYEYCTQSHLSSEDYEQAMQGLRITRRFKRYMIWCYKIPAAIVRMVRVMLNRILNGKVSERRSSLVWNPTRVGTAPTVLRPAPGRSLRAPERSSGREHSRRPSRDHLLPLASSTSGNSSHSRSSSEAAV